MMTHAAVLRDALLTIDLVMLRRLWPVISPARTEAPSDYDILTTAHLARLEMRSCSERGKAYSRAWLAEHRPVAAAFGVGISVRHFGNRTSARTESIEHEGREAVLRSVQDGLVLGDREDDAEVTRRMRAAMLRG